MGSHHRLQRRQRTRRTRVRSQTHRSVAWDTHPRHFLPVIPTSWLSSRARHLPDDPDSMTRDPGLDNQIAAHLLTHPNTGKSEPVRLTSPLEAESGLHSHGMPRDSSS
ncbi:hypothetical protein OG21DRAFT_334937 [Imleria badia]|nr:hypothetical protein OG21DRAFT_334937 [Imleria badia]